MTFAIGPSSETLYLYLVGAFLEILGPGWFPFVLLSILCSMGCVVLAVLVTRALSPATPPAIPFLLSAGSVWLFHFGQLGIRSISAPLFFLALLLVLRRSEDRVRPGGTEAAFGVLLGLSLYAYTACRILVIGYVLSEIVAFTSLPAGRWSIRRRAGRVAAGALLASIPNILFFLREPSEFLTRGYYCLVGGPLELVGNVAWTFLFPFYYPLRYRVPFGPGHAFDNTGVSLTASGVAPLDLVTAVALTAGLVVAWTRRREPAMGFLLSSWLAGSVVLGVSGPSLTRLLVLLPAYILFASLAFGEAWRRLPRLRPLTALALVVPAVTGAWGYIYRFGSSAEAMSQYFPASSAVTARSGELAEGGKRVLIAVRSNGRDLAKFHNYRHIDRIWLVESGPGPFALQGDPVAGFHPDFVLVERVPELASFASSLRSPPVEPRHPLFDEYRLSWPAGGGEAVAGNIRKLWNPLSR